MPIYTYDCEDCGRRDDYLVQTDQLPTNGCSECGSYNLARTFEGQTFGARTANKAVSPSMVRKGFLVPSHLVMAEVNEVKCNNGQIQVRKVGHTPMVGFRPVFPEDN